VSARHLVLELGWGWGITLTGAIFAMGYILGKLY
jgi:hypothetical protein